MKDKSRVIVTPKSLPQNEILTIRTVCDYFPDKNYVITDEGGRIIRKGSISHGINEFKLCMVGLKTGAYRLIMGQQEEKFNVT
jgi:hypothetical protein